MRVVLIAAVGLAACSPDAPTNMGRAEPTAASPAGCAAHLSVGLDGKSFDAAQLGEAPSERARWRDQSAAAFKRAANSLCAGEMDRSRLANFKALLIQYGGGADSTAVWHDGDRPETLILQYDFSPGAPAPDQADVRDGLICWNDPNAPICPDRMP